MRIHKNLKENLQELMILWERISKDSQDCGRGSERLWETFKEDSQDYG